MEAAARPGACIVSPFETIRGNMRQQQGRWRVAATGVSAFALCALIIAATSRGERVTVQLEGSGGTNGRAITIHGASALKPNPVHDVVQMLAQLDRVMSAQDHDVPHRPSAHQQELAMKPSGGLHNMVMMLAAEVKQPGVCDKKEMIFEKLEALLDRLGGRAAIINATDAQEQKKAETALDVWLSVESLYRMSQEKYDEAAEASKFVMHQLEVAKAVEKLTQKSVQQVIEEYPGKKKEINEEKEIIIEIIGMVEDMDIGGKAANKAAPAQLKYIKDEFLSIDGHARPMSMQDELAKLSHIHSQLNSITSSMPAASPSGSGGGKALKASVNKLSVKEDVEVTKAAILKILMDLLREPDFRDHLLELGIKAAHAQLAKDEGKVTDLEEKEVALGDEEDRSEHDVDSSNLERNKAAGNKIAQEESYVNEHKDFLSETSANAKGVYIITTIINKIRQYCAKLPTPSADAAQAAAPSSATSSLAARGKARASGQRSAAAGERAIRPLLAAARAAAQAAWVAGGG